MYASQTKRLCVRGAVTSDESTSRVQHPHSASLSDSSPSEAATSSTPAPIPTVPFQQQSTSTPLSSSSHHPTPAAQLSSICSSRFDTTTSTTFINPTQSSSASAAVAAVPIGSASMTASATVTPRDNKSATQNAPQPNLLSNQPTTTTTPTNQRPAEAGTPTTTSYTQDVSVNQSSNLDRTHAYTHSTSNSNSSNERDTINKLATATLEEAQLEATLTLRNLVTACDKKKETLVDSYNFIKIIEKLESQETSIAVKSQLALLLCSLSKGGEHTVTRLNEYSVDEKVFMLVLNIDDEAFIEAGLRYLRSIMSWHRVSRAHILYESLCSQTFSESCAHSNGQEVANLEKLISLCLRTNSPIIQECVADLFALTCRRSKDQVMLFKASPMPCILRLLESHSCRVVISTLHWLNQMCLKNHTISAEAVKSVFNNKTTLLGKLTKMMNHDECLELQFLAAQCFVHMYKALATDELKDDSRVHGTVLPTLVRMVHNGKPPHLRVKAAECITYLIEHDTHLQNTASICDRLIESLADMLHYEPSKVSDDLPKLYTTSSPLERGRSWRAMTCCLYLPSSHDSHSPATHLDLIKSCSTHDVHIELSLEMRRVAFLALASLGSNLEAIRKKILNTCSIMQHLVKNLNDGDSKTLIAVLSCLLSLSRSVQQLRTSFTENSVYSALKNLLTTSSNEVLVLVLAVLSNISLDFSPGKQHFLDLKTVETLCTLARNQDPLLRLHSMWILMNMVYQLKDLGVKIMILDTLGLDHVLELLETENNDELVMKTLGFLRNLISQRSHIDAITSKYGDRIMKSLVRVLERESSPRLKEQTLCVLTNIADGIESKSLIMNNRAVLNYLARTICDEQAGDLRLAAICCITNLIQKDQDGSYERRDEMKKFGIEEKLKSLLETKNPILFDRVRTAYNQFLIVSIEDKPTTYMEIHRLT